MALTVLYVPISLDSATPEADWGAGGAALAPFVNQTRNQLGHSQFD